jgi:hypothetical protein
VGNAFTIATPTLRRKAVIGIHGQTIASIYREYLPQDVQFNPKNMRCTMNRSHASLRLLSASLLAMLVLQGCNALNPLCGSARPAPSISSLSPTTIAFAQVQHGFLLTVNGSHIVSSSVVVINGTTLPTQVVSNSQLQVTLTTAVITGPGTASVAINTPSGNSGNLGCSSGGTSHTLMLTIT